MSHGRKPGRPPLYRNAERMSLHVPASLLRRIEKRAKADKRSLNASMITLAEEALKEKP